MARPTLFSLPEFTDQTGGKRKTKRPGTPTKMDTPFETEEVGVWTLR